MHSRLAIPRRRQLPDSTPDRRWHRYRRNRKRIRFALCTNHFAATWTWQLAHLKEYGLGVLAKAQAGAPPFNQPWPDWRPDPAWGPLKLPEGWAE